MPAPSDLDLVPPLAVAALAGLAVGIEREWSGRAPGAEPRFAGVRTFFLLGLLGGVAGWLASTDLAPAGLVLLAGGMALVAAAYLGGARRGKTDATTEAAALVVLALGLMAGLGHLRFVSGAAAVVVLALSEKERMHALVRRIGEREMLAALQFAVLALVVLPLLPEGPYGPWGGVRPRALWTVVLLFTALNFAGFLARRWVGSSRGYPVAGMLGGLVSSTAVTLNFSRESRRTPAVSTPLGVGVLGACTVLVPRVLVVSTILRPQLAQAALVYLVPPLAVGAALVAFRLRRRDGAEDGPGEEVRNPLRLWSAVKMALAFQVVLTAVTLARTWFGEAGVLATAAVLGLTDMDALTLSMTRLAADASMVPLAAAAVGVGVLSNTLLKLTLTLVFGSPAFRRVASLGLLLMAAASALGLWLGTRAGLP